MARRVNAGEMRTKIRVVRTRPIDEDGADEDVVDEDGVPVGVPVEVLSCRCKWVNGHGDEVYKAKQAGVTEPATLTMRYTPKVTTTCEIYRGSDPRPYEVISVNDVEDRHVCLEVRVQRKAASK